MTNLILPYAIKFFKIPLSILIPFILCIILHKIFWKYTNSAPENNKIYAFLKLHEDNPIIKLVDSFSHKVYYIMSNITIFKQDLSIFLPVNNTLFGVNFLYLLYFAIATAIILISFKQSNYLSRSRKNTIFFRNLAEEHFGIKPLDIEISLLITDNIIMKLTQFSLFFSIGFILNPCILELYITILDYTIFPFGKNIFLSFLVIFILLLSPLISLLIALILFHYFFKKNIFVYLLQKIIIKNFIKLNNLEKEKLNNNTNALRRIAMFGDIKIKKYFRNYKT